jgi:uncharacterized membrane protein
MQKGLGIAALVIAIISIFVPFIGTWLTLVAGLLAVFAFGPGLAFGIAAIVINVVHILFFSPLLWATQGAMSVGAAAEGANVVFLPWILILIQGGALVGLFVLHKSFKQKAPQPA